MIGLRAKSGAKKVGLSIMDFSGHWIFVAKSQGIFSVRRLFWGISMPPTNKDLAFVTVPFPYVTMTFATTLLRSLAGALKRKTRWLTHISPAKCSWWPVWSWLDRSQIMRKIQRFLLTRIGNVNIFRELKQIFGMNILKILLQYSTYTG